MVPTCNFLRLTLENESFLPASTFTLKNKTQVEIWDTGVIAFFPKTTNINIKDIVLSSGIHGNETAPVEIVNKLIKDTLKEKIELSHNVLFIIAHPKALNKNVRFIDENMNRLFSENILTIKNTKNIEQKRAFKIAKYLKKFFNPNNIQDQKSRIHYDLHTAIRDSKYKKFAVYPYINKQKWKRELLNFLLHCGVEALLLFHEPSTTLSYFSSSYFKADSLTIELGKALPFSKNEVSVFELSQKAFIDLITIYKNSIKYTSPDLSALNTFTVNKIINRTQSSFNFTFADNVQNFTVYPKNTVLGFDGDKPFKTESDEDAVIFPLANVPIGHRALLIARPFTIPKDMLI